MRPYHTGGGGEYTKFAAVVFRGCFETSTASPDLQHSTGVRPAVGGGAGFEALQACARRCQKLHLPYMAMNDDGCWCDDQFGSGGTFQRVPTEECAASTLALMQCGAGPCGARPLRNAVYEVAPAPSGAASTVGPGNFVARVKAGVGVAFQGEWRFRARSTAFEWMLRVVEAGSGRVLAHKTMSKPGVAAVAVELAGGSYDVELFGAFGNKGAMSAGSEAIEFLQKSHCNVTEWLPLQRGALAVCTPDPPVAPPAPPPPPLVIPAGWDEQDVVPDSPEDPDIPEGAAIVTVEEHPRARDTEEDEDTGAPMTLNPALDGAFLTMKIGGIDMDNPLGLKDAVMDNYIMFQGRFMLLGYTVEIDMSIKPGSMEAGGGIKFQFYFNWAVEGVVSVMELGGHMDLVPLDVEKLLGFQIQEFLSELTLSMGIWIKPNIINQILGLAEAVIKIALAAIVVVVLAAIVAVQFILENLVVVLELMLAIVHAAERGVAAAERVLQKSIDKMKGSEGRYQKMEHRINGPLRLLRDASFCEDAKANMASKCGGDIAASNRPDYCKIRVFMSSPRPLDCKRIASRAGQVTEELRGRCCTEWKYFLRGFLKFIVAIVEAFATLLFAILRAVLSVIRLALQVAQVAVSACSLGLRLAVKGVNDILGSGATGDGRRVDIAAFWRWLWGTALLRIWYLGVSASFSLSAMTFKADVDFVILQCSVKVRITFSLDFAVLLKSFMEFVADLFMSLFGMGSTAAAQCGTGAVKASEGEVVTNTPALGAAAAEVTLHDAAHPHGAVFHAARAAHFAQLGARRLDANAGGGRFGLEGIWRDAAPEPEHDAGEGLVWRVDHRGEESLVEESRLGRHVRMSQENHAAAASHIASAASKLGARGAFARFAHVAAAALRVRDGKSEHRTGENVNVEGARAVDAGTGSPAQLATMKHAFAVLAGSPMDKEVKVGPGG